MKKISLLLAAILASVTVSGCDAFTSFFGGDSSKPQDQQKSEDDSKKEDNGNSDPWEQEEQESDYAVAFDNNEGSGDMAVQTTDGSEFVVPECTFTRDGYHFIKWGLRVNEEWTYYFVGDKITGIKNDIILYAIWEEDSAASYTVTLYANNGTSEYITATTTGSIFVAPSCTFSKTYYDFDKWALGSASGTKYEIGKTISNISSDIALYATWKEHNYTVTLYANNGTGASTTATTNGFTYTTPSCSFSYSGHSFDGWAYGSPTGTKYSVNRQITNIHENISLYATWVEGSSDTYYSQCEGLSGSALQAKLLSINKPQSPSYDWGRYEDADEALDDSTCIISLYTRHNIKKSNHVSSSTAWDLWNKEHIWTQSAYPASKTDNHNIFACEGKINGERSNKPFAEGGQTVVVFGHTTDCKQTTSTFEPCDEAKGEVARSVMYGTVMYSYTMTQIIDSIYLALKWHTEHPITERDIRRNEVVYENQGNRNPFVDHPEYACKIWGTTNSQTRSICGM